MNKKEIVLIEDSDADAHLAERALRAAGIVNPILRFSTGAAALEYLVRAHEQAPTLSAIPSVLIVDLNLPDIHGLDILKYVRQQPLFGKTLRVVLSQLEDLVSIRSAYALGANTFLVKPLSHAELMGLVQGYPGHWIFAPPPGHSQAPSLGPGN